MGKEDEKLFQKLENNLDEIKDETAAGTKIEEKQEQVAVSSGTKIEGQQEQAVASSGTRIEEKQEQVAANLAAEPAENAAQTSVEPLAAEPAGNAAQTSVEAAEGPSTSINGNNSVSQNEGPETANNGQIAQNSSAGLVPASNGSSSDNGAALSSNNGVATAVNEPVASEGMATLAGQEKPMVETAGQTVGPTDPSGALGGTAVVPIVETTTAAASAEAQQNDAASANLQSGQNAVVLENQQLGQNAQTVQGGAENTSVGTMAQAPVGVPTNSSESFPANNVATNVSTGAPANVPVNAANPLANAASPSVNAMSPTVNAANPSANAAQGTPAQSVKPKKSKKIVVLVIVLVIALLMGIGVGVWLLLGNNKKPTQSGNTGSPGSSQTDPDQSDDKDNPDDKDDQTSSSDNPKRDKLVPLDTQSDEVQEAYHWFGDLTSASALRFFEDELIGNKKDAVKLGRVEVALANTGTSTCRATWQNDGLNSRYGDQLENWDANRKKVVEECRDAQAVQTKYREVFGNSLNLERMQLTSDGMYFSVKGRYWDYSKDYNEFFNTLVEVDDRTQVVRNLMRAAQDGNRLYLYEMVAALTCEETAQDTTEEGEGNEGDDQKEQNEPKVQQEVTPSLLKCRARRMGSASDSSPLYIWNGLEEVPTPEEVFAEIGNKVVVEYVFNKNSNGKYIFDSISYVDNTTNNTTK